MKFKPGDHIELDATVRGLFPQGDDLLVALELENHGRINLHDRWLIRTETGPLSEGEEVRIAGKVTRVRDDPRGDWITVRLDGATVPVTVDAKWARRR